MNAPNSIDGAEVVLLAEGQGTFGTSVDADGVGHEIIALVLARYPDDEAVFLFACDSAWSVRGNLYYSDLEEAKLDAPRYYGRTKIEWRPPPPAPRSGGPLTNPPTAAEINQVFEDVLSGRMTRDAADSWAAQWVAAQSPPEMDDAIWDALGNLFGCAMPAWPDEGFLFTDEQIREWWAAFQQKVSA